MVAAHLTFTAVLFGVLLPDYLLTCVVAVLERQPRLLLLGVFFPFMRVLDACIGLYAIPAAWLVSPGPSGRWRSPARRAVDTGDAAAVPAVMDDRPAVRARPDWPPGVPIPHSPARIVAEPRVIVRLA